MVDTLGLANAVNNSPDYTGRQARQVNAVAFAGATASRPLGALTGVRMGTPSNTVTVTGSTWACGEFAGLADLMVAGESGPYPFAFDATTSGSITPADTNNPRTDIVYVQIIDPEDGTTVPTATRGYLAGVPAATPTAPAAPTGAFTIAQISVPKAGTGSPTVTWVAPPVVAAGGIAQFLTLAALRAWTPSAFQKAQVTNDPTPANNGDYVFTGSAWVATSLTIGGSVKRSGTAATFSTGWTPLTNTAYWTTDQPVSNMNAFNGTFVAPIAGVYDVRIGMQFDSSVNAILCLKKNDSGGSSTGNIVSTDIAGFASFSAGEVAKEVRLNAGDYVAAAVYVSASAIWNTAAPDSSFFSIRWREPLR